MTLLAVVVQCYLKLLYMWNVQ